MKRDVWVTLVISLKTAFQYPLHKFTGANVWSRIYLQLWSFNLAMGMMGSRGTLTRVAGVIIHEKQLFAQRNK